MNVSIEPASVEAAPPSGLKWNSPQPVARSSQRTAGAQMIAATREPAHGTRGYGTRNGAVCLLPIHSVASTLFAWRRQAGSRAIRRSPMTP